MTQNIAETTHSSTIERASAAINLTPAVDIYENDSELLVIADLPQVTRDSLSVEVNHPELKIEGRVVANDRHPEYHYTRKFHLDSSVDVSKIEAKLADGVLEVHLPKSEPFQVRKIAVKSA
jgi:HSP20 family protein